MLTQATLLSPAPNARDSEAAAQLHLISRTTGPFYRPLSRVRIAHARTRRSRAANARLSPSAHFGEGRLNRECVVELLRLAMFDSDAPGLRPYPAAGGIYATHVYINIHDVAGMTTGLYYVRHVDCVLERISPVRSELGHAPMTALLACDTALLTRKYLDRATKFALLEAGALVQTLYLAAEALQLNACAQGGVSDRSALEICQAQHTLFACCVAFSARSS